MDPDISVGIAMEYELKAGIRFPTEARDFSLLHSVQNGFGTQLASYPMGKVKYIFLTSALVGGEWSASSPGHSTPEWVPGAISLEVKLPELVFEFARLASFKPMMLCVTNREATHTHTRARTHAH
jgi:hypothetical protein